MLCTTLYTLALFTTFAIARPHDPRDAPHKALAQRATTQTAAKPNLLFPYGTGHSFWSTSPSHPASEPLQMKSFKPTAAMEHFQPTFNTAPDGSHAMHTHFNKGAYEWKGPVGGISFYAVPMDFSNAKEVTLAYSAFFPKGFAFNLGGKMPGMYGGDSAEEAISCSGGRRDTGCWSARYMFRPDGEAELYTYLPDPSFGKQFKANKALCTSKPGTSSCNDAYGASVGRGAFSWTTGKWTTVSQRIRLNDVGQSNGQIEVHADGKQVVNLESLVLRDSEKGQFRGIQMQMFFGGHAEEWASPKDQDIFTKDYSIAITQHF